MRRCDGDVDVNVDGVIDINPFRLFVDRRRRDRVFRPQRRVGRHETRVVRSANRNWDRPLLKFWRSGRILQNLFCRNHKCCKLWLDFDAWIVAQNQLHITWRFSPSNWRALDLVLCISHAHMTRCNSESTSNYASKSSHNFTSFVLW